MRYMSDDGKVFNSEQECCEHEQKLEVERMRQEEIENERKNRLDDINKKYDELQTLISEYKTDYGDNHINLAPFHDVMRMLFGI